MDNRYLPPVPGALWAISRSIGGRTIYLVEGARLDNRKDAEAVLLALGLPPTESTLNLYFPTKTNGAPTLELMELCSKLDPTNPVHKKVREVVASV